MGLDGIYLHDPTCVMAAIRPDLFNWVEGSVRVATEGIARGRTLMDDGSKSWVSDNSWTGRPKMKCASEIRPLPPAKALVPHHSIVCWSLYRVHTARARRQIIPLIFGFATTVLAAAFLLLPHAGLRWGLMQTRL